MGESKHTPGPWVAEDADHFGDHNIVLGNAVEVGDYRAVAAVVSNMRQPDAVAANARLIAAAPELLDALRQLRNETSGKARPSELIRINALADAALAKAEGRS